MNATYLFFCLQFACALVLAPLLPGIINKIKALAAGRRGKPVLQTYYDLLRLWRKGEVISSGTTWVFAAGPSISLACSILALAFLPLGGARSPLGFSGDFILAAYLLGMGRFAVMLSALDTGSSFEGMGASREAAFSAFAEPAFFLAFLVLASICLNNGNENAFALSSMFNGQTALAWQLGRPELILVPVVFLILLLVENCRIPFDDPATHLELTMIHEVMVLDHSGPNLGMIIYASALKLWFFASLIALLIVPPLEFWPRFLWNLVAISGVAILTGIIESVMARLRLPRVPQLLGLAAALGALGLILSRAS